tara:strand:- start:636 stop:758 length:123 start_codon:yes stop_codon:yes gene_type:complete
MKHAIICANGIDALTLAIEPDRGTSLPRQFLSAAKRGVGR